MNSVFRKEKSVENKLLRGKNGEKRGKPVENIWAKCILLS